MRMSATRSPAWPSHSGMTHGVGGCVIPLWDGHAGDRVADILIANYVLTSAVAAQQQ